LPTKLFASWTIDWTRGSAALVAELPNVPEAAVRPEDVPLVALLFSSACTSAVSSLEELVAPVVELSAVELSEPLPRADSSALSTLDDVLDPELLDPELLLAGCSALSSWLSPPLNRLLASVLASVSVLGSVPASDESSTDSALVPSWDWAWASASENDELLLEESVEPVLELVPVAAVPEDWVSAAGLDSCCSH
jgi:hypothetical protein